MKKIIGTVVLVILIVLALFFLFRKSREGEEAIKTVTVQRGTVAEKALAVGTIEPENEIKVKSTISGIVKDLFFKVGDTVEKGKPLFSVSPNPTPVEYTETLRAMEVSKESFEQAQRERNRKRELFAAKIISPSEMDSAESLCREAELRFRVNREKYELLESGRIKTAGAGDRLHRPIPHQGSDPLPSGLPGRSRGSPDKLSARYRALRHGRYLPDALQRERGRD